MSGFSGSLHTRSTIAFETRVSPTGLVHRIHAGILSSEQQLLHFGRVLFVLTRSCHCVRKIRSSADFCKKPFRNKWENIRRDDHWRGFEFPRSLLLEYNELQNVARPKFNGAAEISGTMHAMEGSKVQNNFKDARHIKNPKVFLPGQKMMALGAIMATGWDFAVHNFRRWMRLVLCDSFHCPYTSEAWWDGTSSCASRQR